MLDEIRHALRSLARIPGFSAVAVLTFALGIGATTAIYSVVNRVLLRPLPLPDAERLVTVWTRMPDAKIDQLPVAHAEYLDYRRETQLMEEVGACTELPATLTGVGEPARVVAGLTTASLWSVVRIAPHLGRTFAPGDDVAGAEPIAVLSHGLWRSRFGSDPAVVGRMVQLDGKPRRVVGVLSPGFDFTQSSPDIWVPYVLDPNRRDNHHLYVIGRLKRGATFSQLQPEMDGIVARWSKAYSHAHPFVPITLRDAVVGPVRKPLSILFAAAVLVMLVCATNVAGLLLARGESRQRELAIRAAMGAGRGVLVRRLLLESVMLACAGGLLGLLVARGALAGILSLAGVGLPQVGEIGLDLPVLLFGFAVSLLAGGAAGLIPAWRASRPDLAGILKGAGERASGGSTRQRVRSSLVIAETAAAVVLVASAALLVRSLWNLTHVDAGVEPDHVLVAQLTLPAATYPKAPDVVAFYDRVLERLSALPGVRSAALVSALPMGYASRLILVGGPWQPPNAEPLGAQVVMATPGYLSTIGTRLVRGRAFTAADRPGAARVAAINQAAARALFGDTDPLGKPLSIVQAQPKEPTFEIVAVVADVRTAGLGTEAGPQVFLPLAQAVTDIRGVTRGVTAVLKTVPEPGGLAADLRAAVWALDPKLAVAGVETMDQVVSASLGPQRFQATLLGSFAALALVLAAIGLYGLLAHLVGLRRRELGIRSALGARPEQLLTMVLRQGLSLAAVGVLVGVVAALATGRALAGLVSGVGGWDPVCLAATAFVLLVTASLAGYLPARRAATVDPALTIREE